MAFRLLIYLDCKDSYYYFLNSLLQVYFIDELKEDELDLEEEFREFSFFSADDAHTNYRELVLRRMKIKAKFIGVDLKPYYMYEQAF